MAEFNYIEFQRTRDFSNKMNATFEFAKQNFKSFFKAVLYIAGPPAIVTSLLVGSIFQTYMSLALGSMASGGQENFLNYVTSANFWVNVIFIVVLAAVAVVALTATVNSYIILYREKRSNQIEVEEVWRLVRKTFFSYLVTYIGWFFLMFFLYLVMAVVVIGIGLISPWLLALGYLAFLVGYMYVWVATSLINPLQGFESTGFFKGVSRSFVLIKGKWWSTFGLLFVLTMIIYIVSLIFFIPWYISMIVTVIHNVETQGTGADPEQASTWFGVLSISLFYLSYFVLTAIPHIGLVFQYFNLVEMKESRGLIEKMETMGAPETPQELKEDY